MTFTPPPLISIVIPTFNRAGRLPLSIRSAMDQTYPNTEIIIVDDGSTDNTREALAGYGSAIRYFRQENAGASAARNRGVREARGEWVAFLDSDDRWYPEKLARQARLFSAPSISAVHCAMRVVNTRRNGTQAIYYPGDLLGLHDVLALRIPWPSGMVVRRLVLQDVGGFDESLMASEDWDLCIRIARKYPLTGIPEVLADYYADTPDHLSGIDSRFSMEQRIQRKYRRLLEHQCAACHRALNIARRIQKDWHFAQLCALSRTAYYRSQYSDFLRFRIRAFCFNPIRALREFPGVAIKFLRNSPPEICANQQLALGVMFSDIPHTHDKEPQRL
jgi:glycosyltransferase involved in cell wall biosynthesis